MHLLYNYFERPSSLPDEKGCILSVNDGGTNLDMGGSLSIPLNVIDAGKVCCFTSSSFVLVENEYIIIWKEFADY